MVTLLEKVDALARRVPNQARSPATFVRHYEDAARIITTAATLPPLERYDGPRQLAEEMLRQRQIKPLPGPEHPAFALAKDARGESIRSAFEAIGPMYWGPRMPLDACLEVLRGWLASSGVRPEP